MVSKDNVFINIIVDEHGKAATDSVSKRLMKVGQIVDQTSTKFKETGKVWTKHSYMLRTSADEYDVFSKKLAKFKNQVGKLKSARVTDTRNVSYEQNYLKVQERIANARAALDRTEDKSTQKILKRKISRFQEEEKYWDGIIKTRNTIYANSFQYAQKYDAQRQKFREDLYRNSMQYSTKYYAQQRKEEEQTIRRGTEVANAWARIKSAQARAVRIPTGDLNILLKSVDPEVADGIHDTVRQVNRLYDTSDRLKRYSGTLHRISMGFLAINMSALGMYFSMFSVITLLRSGISSLFGPLSDIGGAFEQLAMSEAFGMGIGQNLDPEKIITAWERFTGLQADIQSMLLVLGTEVLTDPKVWDAVSSAMKSVFDTLSQPETINAIKSLVIALANALPAVARELPGIANTVTAILPYLEPLIPIAIKAAIAMPFLSLATGVASFVAALARGVVWLARFYANYKALGALGAIGKALGLTTIAAEAASGVAAGAGAGAAGGAAGGILGTLATKLKSAWTTISTFIKSIPMRIVSLLGGVIPALSKFITGIPGAIATVLSTTAGTIIAGLVGGLIVGAAAINVLNIFGVLDWAADIGDGFRTEFIKKWDELASDTGILGALARFGEAVVSAIGNAIGDALNILLSPTGGGILTNSKMNEILQSGGYSSTVMEKLMAKYGTQNVSYENGSYYVNGEKITAYATGGYINKSGLAYLHQGEYVVPKNATTDTSSSSPSTITNTFNINVYGNMTREVNDDLINKLANAVTYGGGI